MYRPSKPLPQGGRGIEPDNEAIALCYRVFSFVGNRRGTTPWEN